MQNADYFLKHLKKSWRGHLSRHFCPVYKEPLLIKAIFSGSLEWSLYSDLSVIAN
jgi:hypothetical protein